MPDNPSAEFTRWWESETDNIERKAAWMIANEAWRACKAMAVRIAREHYSCHTCGGGPEVAEKIEREGGDA